MSEGLSSEDRQRGQHLMARANALTDFRIESAPVLGAIIAATNESWITTAAFGVEAYTDWQDGNDARKGAKILGIVTTIAGAIKDQKADKDLVNNVLLGLTARFIRQDDYTSSAILGANYAVLRWRDKKMAEDRQLALEHGIDPKAILINKVKTDFLLGGEAILSSPPAKNRLYRTIGLGVLTAGTALGVAGERIFNRRVRRQLLLNQLKQAAACPDVIPSATD